MKKRNILWAIALPGASGLDFLAMALEADPWAPIRDVAIVVARAGLMRRLLEGDHPPQSIISPTVTSLQIFDWHGEPLALESRAGDVPRPGIVVLAVNVQESRSLDGIAAEARSALEQRERTREQLREWMNGPAAQLDPALSPVYDVFVSHGPADEVLATEMRSLLESRGLLVYVSGSGSGCRSLFGDRNRAALVGSRVALALLTPASVRDDRVLAEAGAFWALDKPIVPAAAFLEAAEVPEFYRERQLVRLDSQDAKQRCAERVGALCAATPA